MRRPPLPSGEDVGHVHLIAVGGVGMGGLAGLFAQSGRRVTGSDGPLYPPISDLLGDLKIPVSEGYRPENLSPLPDLVVVGNAVSRENPEALSAVEIGLPLASMPEALAHYFIGESHAVVVAGTHGKTFTTSLLAWMLQTAGLDPGFLIGGIPKNFGVNFAGGGGELFVVEGDEYDTAFFDKGPKFLHYRPRTLILTSIEFDHADIYPDVGAIEENFRRLVELVPSSGLVVACADDQRVAALVESATCRVDTYGLGRSALWRAEEVRAAGEATSFRVVCGDEAFRPYWWGALGRHNVQNALAAIAVAHEVGLSYDQVSAALNSFEGVRRRMEPLGEPSGVLVVEDFAHHPTAVRSTVAALRERYPARRLWAVFEPRTNTSRRRIFQEAYAGSFEGADRVVVAAVHRAEAVPAEERFDPERLARDLSALGISARHIPEVEDIVETIAAEAQEEDVVLIMSNGAFGGIYGKLLRALEEREMG
ncbi:MAG: UDP-N-acetylmuramate:L-alanyl-gamma-D-glutamyl-meso-diaminopimelate ligase [bacterium]|nr:UDP-N-acetylmuramate:L-alanyl-gamma-D-glutamyl-meso-diaminopimelate ligase [bacterium]